MSPIHRGEVYFADFGPLTTLASGGTSIEIARTRPVVVVSIEALNRVSDRMPFYVIVVPGTTGASAQKVRPTNVRLSASETGLPQETVFVAHQLKSVDRRRLGESPLGRLRGPAFDRLEAAVRYVLGVS